MTGKTLKATAVDLQSLYDYNLHHIHTHNAALQSNSTESRPMQERPFMVPAETQSADQWPETMRLKPQEEPDSVYDNKGECQRASNFYCKPTETKS